MSKRCTVYGPVPSGSVASRSMLAGVIIAPVSVAMDHSHASASPSMVTAKVCSSSTCVSTTGAIWAFNPFVHSFCT